VLRSEPRAPSIDRRTDGQTLGPDPATYTVPGFEDDDGEAALTEPEGSSEAGEPGPNHTHIGIEPFHGDSNVPTRRWPRSRRGVPSPGRAE